MIGFDTGGQRLRREVRPEDLREQKLRIGRLPQQEIGQPLLAARPDQQIRVGDTGRIERLSDRLFRDLLRQEFPALHLRGQPDSGPAQFVAGAVIQRHHQRHALVLRGVAHQFIQKLVDAVKELPEERRLEGISELIDKEYERRLDEALQTTGLLLLLKENEVEYNNLRFLLKRSVKKLVKILEHKHLIPVACELKHSLPVFSDGSDFNARIDFELKDGAGNAVIFDFKWTYSSYYGNKIKEGTAIQLELYRKELEAEGKTVAAVGYYLLPKCVLDTSDFDTFKDAEDGRILIRHIDPPAGNNRFQILENSVSERKGEILAGDIEEGEEMDILGLTYSQALMGGKDMLWPGKPYKKSPTKANPDPPVERVNKESKKVFVDKIDTRFSKKKAEFQDKVPANEKSTTYPLLKGRLK